MQTCSNCHIQVADNAISCPNCQADLKENSTTAVALRRFCENPRVLSVRISVAADACPACQAVQGDYPKDRVPMLPVEGCSGSNGCCCFYEPVLSEVYP